MASGHCLLATTTTKNGVPSALAPALWTCATGATANHVSANTRQPQTTLAPAMGREGDVIVGPIFASWPCTASAFGWSAGRSKTFTVVYFTSTIQIGYTVGLMHLFMPSD